MRSPFHQFISLPLRVDVLFNDALLTIRSLHSHNYRSHDTPKNVGSTRASFAHLLRWLGGQGNLLAGSNHRRRRFYFRALPRLALWGLWAAAALRPQVRI